MSARVIRLPRIGTYRWIALSQLASLAVFGVLLFQRWPRHPTVIDLLSIACFAVFAAAATSVARSSRGVHRTVFATFAALAVVTCATMLYFFLVPSLSLFAALQTVGDAEIAIVIGTMNTLLIVYGGYALSMERLATAELAKSVVAERELSATLEMAVATRTVELEDAQRVLQRMWRLGQQIALELNPQRVLDRFLEAVVDIVQATDGAVFLASDHATLRCMAGTGVGAALVGGQMPTNASKVGAVILSGERWSVSDVRRHAHELNPEMLARISQAIRAIAVVPIARRGERIGAVVVGSADERTFSTEELDRVEVMADLLSLALENAELVDSLRQTEWRFRTLFRAAPDAVFTVLQSGRVREANDAVRDVTGYDPLQVLGREFVELVEPSDREKLERALGATFGGTPTRLEIAMTGANSGARHVVELAMRRLPEADPPSVLLVGRDVTKEREMRVRMMESDRLAAVGELVAGVAHEVNNPLSSISAFAQLLLRDGGLTQAQHDSIEVIKSETLRASQVVKDLLAFARRSEPQREALDLNALVTRTLRMRGYQFSANKVRPDLVLATELPAVIGDARQLQQVCLNLVTNAIQAMAPLGGGSLVVTTRVVEGGECVVLEMSDTGPGIPDGARAHIFEPFFTTKKEGEGTGLGLSVSYGIISAHGGTIEVAESSPAGTTFRVVLPAAAAQAAGTREVDSLPRAHRSPLAGIRLLFVDDEASLRNSMETFAKLRGFAVVTAADGLQALSAVNTTSFDAVVCDLRMPGLDGFGFHERLRAERPGLAMRTIFITGDVVSTQGGARSAGTKQPVISKPFAFEKLEEALVAILRGSPRAVSLITPSRGMERVT